MMNFPSYIKNIRRKGQRYFTLKQSMMDLNLSKNAALVAIHRLKKHGDLISPSQGLYIIVPAEYQLQGSIPAEELVTILMKYLKADYYISLLSGAQYHGASHQKPARFQVITNKRSNHLLEFGQIKIELIYKKNIKSLPIQDVVVNTGYLKVASPELVIYDLLSYPNHSGGLNNIATVLSELIDAVDIDKLIQLADIVGEKAWLQRVGFILEQIDYMNEKKAIQTINRLQEYLKEKMSVFVALTPDISKIGYTRNKKWRIIENINIDSDL